MRHQLIKGNWTRTLMIVGACLQFSIFNLQPSICHAQVGTWTAHMAYYEPQQILKAGSNHLFVRASNSLYLYNLNDQSITTFDRSRQLNDTYVSKIAWNEQAKRLLVYYDNANIDILDLSGNVRNISSIYSKPMTQSKYLNSVFMYQNYAYMAMNFGVVKLSMDKAEIAETYMLNKPISHVCIADGKIYARYVETSASGFLVADVSTNLLDFHNWTETNSYPQTIYASTDGNAWEQYHSLVETLKPLGPKHNYFGFMTFKNDILYSCSGGGLEQTRPGTVQIFDGNDWIFLQDDMSDIEKEQGGGWAFVNTYSIDIDPRDSKHVFVGARPGLFEFQDGQLVKYYNKDNSILNTATSSNRYVLVPSVLYDAQGNLWLLQRGVLDNSILEIDADGELHSYYQEMLMKSNGKSLNGLMSLIQDSRELLWFVNHHYETPSFYCFDPSTKKVVNYMTTLVNQDGVIIDSYQPHCIEEDMDGNLWLGTSVGLFEIEASTVGSQLQYVTQVKVPRNDGTNYADYLMDGVNISCIAVDQANRKWIGTNGAGVYLISADNMEQMANFTASNSPLLSDNIESLCINHDTGEVFIGTDRGLCSYMSDATVASVEIIKDNVYAYPNPVVSSYDGLISIVGLTRDADVKILTVNGQLVAQGRSNGGTFTWNGRDSRGHRVASGVYMVAAAKSDGSKGTVCKIAVIN